MLMVLARTSSPIADVDDQSRIVADEVAGDAAAGHPPDPGGNFLDGGHEREGHDERPAEPVPELRADLGIGCNAGGIVVGGAGDEPRPHDLDELGPLRLFHLVGRGHSSAPGSGALLLARARICRLATLPILCPRGTSPAMHR
jgi:hypothetical protein